MAIQEFETEQEMDDAFEKTMEDLQEEERIKTARPRPQLTFDIDVECPKCGGLVDLTGIDWFVTKIFSNKWGELEWEHITCDGCECEFIIGEIEY
jgi:hypothetical protein